MKTFNAGDVIQFNNTEEIMRAIDAGKLPSYCEVAHCLDIEKGGVVVGRVPSWDNSYSQCYLVAGVRSSSGLVDINLVQSYEIKET